MLGIVSRLGLCAEILVPGCISDSSRTGLSASQHGDSIKKGRLWTRLSAGGLQEGGQLLRSISSRKRCHPSV